MFEKIFLKDLAIQGRAPYDRRLKKSINKLQVVEWNWINIWMIAHSFFFHVSLHE